MALFGNIRDVDTFKIISKELVNDVITTQIGYYKPVLIDTVENIYGESLNKTFIGPVLLNCLIERGDMVASTDEFGPDVNKAITFKFLKDDMIDANVVSEIGDIVMHNELFYEVDTVNENQLILGKDNKYSYSDGLENFGGDYSVILITHYTRGDKLGITKQRL